MNWSNTSAIEIVENTLLCTIRPTRGCTCSGDSWFLSDIESAGQSLANWTTGPGLDTGRDCEDHFRSAASNCLRFGCRTSCWRRRWRTTARVCISPGQEDVLRLRWQLRSSCRRGKPRECRRCQQCSRLVKWSRWSMSLRIIRNRFKSSFHNDHLSGATV